MGGLIRPSSSIAVVATEVVEQRKPLYFATIPWKSLNKFVLKMEPNQTQSIELPYDERADYSLICLDTFGLLCHYIFSIDEDMKKFILIVQNQYDAVRNIEIYY